VRTCINDTFDASTPRSVEDVVGTCDIDLQGLIPVIHIQACPQVDHLFDTLHQFVYGMRINQIARAEFFPITARAQRSNVGKPQNFGLSPQRRTQQRAQLPGRPGNQNSSMANHFSFLSSDSIE